MENFNPTFGEIIIGAGKLVTISLFWVNGNFGNHQ